MSVQILPPRTSAEAASAQPSAETRQANFRLALAPWINVRFGITVAKRLERRAVARNTVKRIVREAARHAAGALTDAGPTHQLEVVFRLKSPLPDASAASWGKIKSDLRSEVDQLLAQLRSRLEERTQTSGVRGRRDVMEELAKSARSSDRESQA